MLKYKVIPRKNPSDRILADKYYASIIYNSKIDIDILADRIGRNTTLSKSDIIGVLVALEEEIVDVLRTGSYVELGELCSFYPAIKSSGAVSANDYNAATNITRKYIRVQAKKHMEDSMLNVAVQKV
ncbi:hypothetical protein S1OALGB6SA_2428 [Olavius algarvensis spirochete endosymbiont]|uniref:HU family DNA-binding protein n=1 Tax=Olavius algarvensis spirochete endosymbiont TaxID=260710 RepID=UPI000F252C73|nr:hypothetical protein [Olavius algarvensis spirochete endosymbiont]CAD7841615.1 MAG: hypothetical protein [Olavius algarvensis spirochete endosymbiont]VDB01324.1 hypothetical protein S1OALGB6SA_2428 [Olavius algarvensis spirochete endosymbiont]